MKSMASKLLERFGKTNEDLSIEDQENCNPGDIIKYDANPASEDYRNPEYSVAKILSKKRGFSVYARDGQQHIIYVSEDLITEKRVEICDFQVLKRIK